MIQQIRSGDSVVALLIGNADIPDGTHPITEHEHSLQMLMMKRGKGHVFAKHTHAVLDRSTTQLQEAVVVTKGRLLVTVCTRAGEDLGGYEVSAGQSLMLVDGGYTIEVLEDAAFYEFKNGPFKEDKVLL
jgi:hypothetical protein